MTQGLRSKAEQLICAAELAVEKVRRVGIPREGNEHAPATGQSLIATERVLAAEKLAAEDTQAFIKMARQQAASHQPSGGTTDVRSATLEVAASSTGNGAADAAERNAPSIGTKSVETSGAGDGGKVSGSRLSYEERTDRYVPLWMRSVLQAEEDDFDVDLVSVREASAPLDSDGSNSRVEPADKSSAVPMEESRDEKLLRMVSEAEAVARQMHNTHTPGSSVTEQGFPSLPSLQEDD